MLGRHIGAIVQSSVVLRWSVREDILCRACSGTLAEERWSRHAGVQTRGLLVTYGSCAARISQVVGVQLSACSERGVSSVVEHATRSNHLNVVAETERGRAFVRS